MHIILIITQNRANHILKLYYQSIFDLFNKGRHKYTFQNVCLEDSSIILNDET